MSPLISVITACWNAEEFIEQCLQSVLAQDFGDFEYVIIDGGSTDGTVDIVRCYESQLAYWHSKPDRGLAHAFNQGVERSEGKWLIFLNSDDFFVDNRVLSRMAEHLVYHEDADIVFGQVMLVSREAEPKQVGGPYGKPFQWSKLAVLNTIPHPAAFTNRNYFRRIGPFSEQFRSAVDYEHYLRSGPRLRAHFAPVLVTCMRDGGLSTLSVRASLREGQRAQTITGALPAWRASLQYYAHLFRSFLGQRYRGLSAHLRLRGR